jgi:dipeptidyl-peptidase-4
MWSRPFSASSSTSIQNRDAPEDCPDQHRSTLCDDIACRGGEWADVQWSPDASKLAFVSTSRDHKQERLREADAATGAVREINEESVATQYESGDGKVNWQVLYGIERIPMVFRAQRLRPPLSGRLERRARSKAQITSGDWLVRQVVKVDEKQRVIWFLGRGPRKGRPLLHASL